MRGVAGMMGRVGAIQTGIERAATVREEEEDPVFAMAGAGGGWAADDQPEEVEEEDDNTMDADFTADSSGLTSDEDVDLEDEGWGER